MSAPPAAGGRRGVPRRRLGPSEAAFQAAVVDLAQLRGWRVMHIHDSRRGLGAGYPDLTLLHRATGALLFAELKAANGRLSREQQEWLDDLHKGGHTVHVWRPAHFATGLIQDVLRSPRRPVGAAPPTP